MKKPKLEEIPEPEQRCARCKKDLLITAFKFFEYSQRWSKTCRACLSRRNDED